MVFVPCGECGEQFQDILSFHIHFKTKHRNCQKYMCMIEAKPSKICGRSYDAYNSFRSHLMRSHNVPITKTVPSTSVNTDVLRASASCSESSALEETAPLPPPSSPELVSIAVSGGKYQESLKELLIDQEDLIVCKFYQNPAFPRNLVDKVVNDFTCYLTSPFFERMESVVLSSLDPKLSPEAQKEINDMFNVLKEPFAHLQTEYKRFQYFQNSGEYIKPEAYTIDFREERVKRQGEVTLEMRPVLGQLIPLRKVFKKFFELPDVLEDTLTYMTSLDTATDEICNFVQGEIWKRKRAMFPSDATVIPVNLYFDEVEPNSDLGPHCEPLGCSYVHVPVLPPEWSSRLENIFLALIFDADNRTVYGNKKCFQPLINELLFLEKEGITVSSCVRGEVPMIFVLGLILGDNKGLNGICGFMEGFTANHYCRICTCLKDDAYSQFLEDPSMLRTPESYMADVNMEDPFNTGVKEECIFNQLPSFQAPSDIGVDEFHDVIEGVAHYTMVPVLQHFNSLNGEFISKLNNRLYGIDLGIDSDNRPPLINLDRLTKKGKLKMTGAEMITFIRIFGVLVFDMVPKEDRYYELYLLLNDITCMLLAKHLPKKSAVYILTHKVEDHNRLYVELTHNTLKPKHHFLVHYPRLLSLTGPFSGMSTIRFEAKHRMCTLTANSCMSRVNLPCTIAIKHQLGILYRCVSKASLRQPIVYGPSSVIDLQTLESFPSFSLTLPDVVFNNYSTQNVVNWATFKGTTYKPKQVLLYDVDDIGLCKFGVIEYVIVYDNKPLFICSALETLGLFSDVRGYEVKKNLDVINCFALEHEGLLDPNPLWIYTMSSGENVILLKHVL